MPSNATVETRWTMPTPPGRQSIETAWAVKNI
jgi:hypothetical protein